METYLIVVTQAVLGIGIVLCGIRAVCGPSALDRVMAFDCIALNVVGVMLLDSIGQRTGASMDMVLVVALLGFLGTIRFAAYPEGSLVD